MPLSIYRDEWGTISHWELIWPWAISVWPDLPTAQSWPLKVNGCVVEKGTMLKAVSCGSGEPGLSLKAGGWTRQNCYSSSWALSPLQARELLEIMLHWRKCFFLITVDLNCELCDTSRHALSSRCPLEGHRKNQVAYVPLSAGERAHGVGAGRCSVVNLKWQSPTALVKIPPHLFTSNDGIFTALFRIGDYSGLLS